MVQYGSNSRLGPEEGNAAFGLYPASGYNRRLDDLPSREGEVDFPPSPIRRFAMAAE